MIKKIITKIRLMFAKTYVGIDYGNGTDYTVECHVKKIGNKIHVVKVKRHSLTSVEPDTTASQPVNPECGAG